MGSDGQREEPHLGEDAQIRLQSCRRRSRGPAIVRRGSNPSGVHDRRGSRRAGGLPCSPATRLVALSLVLLRTFFSLALRDAGQALSFALRGTGNVLSLALRDAGNVLGVALRNLGLEHPV